MAANKTQTEEDTNSTENLVKLVTQQVMASMKSATEKTQLTKEKTKKKFTVSKVAPRYASSTPPEAKNRFTEGNDLSTGKYDPAPKGSKFITGDVSTPLADAPSVGANVNARLNRLQNSVLTKIFKKDTGKIEPILQTPVQGINTTVRVIGTGKSTQGSLTPNRRRK